MAMTSEEMEPDVEPPLLLPLQGARVRPATSSGNTRGTTSKPAARQPTRPQTSQQTQPEADVSRQPSSARPATRVATQVRRPLPAGAKKSGDRRANTPVQLKPTVYNARDYSTTRQKPLVPETERRTQESKSSLAPGRARAGSSTDKKWDITPDGGSAGREGRQFTVANVGNNGRIYLRPTIRPAHQRLPQPNFVFPLTPPQTAGLGSTIKGPDKRPDLLDINRLHESQLTLSQDPSTPTEGRLHAFLLEEMNSRRSGLRRVKSDSTIHESSVARESEVGGFKIVITKPGDERRPKTLEDLDTNDHQPLLEVMIPSWKLGVPRWSSRGTPLIRGSSYAPTEEFPSIHHPSHHFAPSLGSRKPVSTTVPSGHASNMSRPMSVLAPDHARGSTFVPPTVQIEPSMFDKLTFKPDCDDRAIVRYSPSTGAVTAATPPRLVAEITSPSFLDYELLSDFFLTYRAYLLPMDLLKMLFVRMSWALSRDDETGMVVRVRTFVALRHWILNYFVDDFVCEYDMRLNFCTLLNSLADEMSKCPKARRVQIKILAELKKCWRRVCAQFWDGPEFEANLPPETPITPGGIPGHRDPTLDPEFWKEFLNDGPPKLDNVYAPLTSNPPDAETSFYRDVAQIGEDGADDNIEFRPVTPEKDIPEELRFQKSQLSPVSLSSAEAISCSLPLKFGTKPGHPLAAHPVDPATTYATGPVAFTPKALSGKRVRSQKTHKKSNSTSDSLRDHDMALEQMLQKNTETLMALPYSGSLVRGNVLPPGQAFVEILTPSSMNRPSRQTTFLRLETDDETRDQVPPSAMSGQGMRKLIGSVRRALSTRGQGISPTEGNFDISPIGPRGVTANRLPGTPIVPQSQPRNNTRPPVRIDLLGAEVVEDFKRVVREDAAEAAAAVAVARSFHGSVPSTPSTVRRRASQGDCTSLHNNDFSQALDFEYSKRPVSDGELTTGSKSIVIVDDTFRIPSGGPPVMTGAIPVFTPSVEAFADSFLSTNGEPSPPTTPPGNTMDTPRRSSYLLGQHVLRSVRSAEDLLPPVNPDLESLEGDAKSPGVAPHSSDYRRRSSEFKKQTSSRPPLTGFQRRARHRSSKSGRSSLVSRGLRRHASFHSGMGGGYSTVRSLDASSYSGGTDSGEVPVPQPLRVLRRRPGGDLRAVDTVNNLGHAELRRSHSIGSFTSATFSSLRTSMLQSTAIPRESTALLEGVNNDSSRGRLEPFSVGMMADKPKRRISLLSTMSSRPVMRPSFELEAQKLANIPDDDDDGGVESALLKLEGKFQKRVATLGTRSSNDPLQAGDFGNRKRPSPPAVADPVVKAEKQKHRHGHIGGEEGVLVYTPLHSPQEESIAARPPSPTPPTERSDLPTTRVEVTSVLSDDSFTSIPLLGGGLTDDGRRSRAAWTNRSILEDERDDGASSGEDDIGAQRRASYALSRKRTNSFKKGHRATHTRSSTQSFLNMTDTEDDDDLSSELSDIVRKEDHDEQEDTMAIPSLRPNASLTKIRTSAIRSRPTDKAVSPSAAMAQMLAVPPMEYAGIPRLSASQVYGSKPLPPTPEYTPTNTNAKVSPDPTGVNEALRNARHVIAHEVQTRRCSAHLPFILAFESEILAQQFTLIEKDALNEIDWKELIDMRWKNAETKDARSWVHFLRDTDAHGVEVVIARFNIVVKWAISEIVLTQDIEERARTIIKYIHIATHCRRYRNFATTSQIAVALTSNEISRLTKTWKLVPPQDIRTLRELETLVSPMRNFYALRAEMEGGGLSSAGTGCIPFVGIYTHDLIFNAQRPGEIASSPNTAPLINFERCRISASIVKALLRLLEASTHYNFQPIEGITERCLWMSALTDEEIRRHSESLQ